MKPDDHPLARQWTDTERTAQPASIGAKVVCDVCLLDWTDSRISGGFIFGSRAYCPACASEGLTTIEAYGEEWYIRARCPHGMSFADFVRRYRGPNNVVQITKHRSKP